MKQQPENMKKQPAMTYPCAGCFDCQSDGADPMIALPSIAGPTTAGPDDCGLGGAVPVTPDGMIPPKAGWSSVPLARPYRTERCLTAGAPVDSLAAIRIPRDSSILLRSLSAPTKK